MEWDKEAASPKARAIVFAFQSRAECESRLETLAALFFEAVDRLGLRYARLGAHVDPNAPPIGAFLWHNFPEAWMARYRARRFHQLDPVLKHAERVKDPFFWDDEAFLRDLSERQSRILSEARLHRIAHGYTIPLCHDAYCPASCSLISESGDFDSETLDIARKIMIALYARASLLARTPGHLSLELLSRRERECLKLKAEGADDHEIAAILGISLPTVRRHFERAKERLAAKSREHAIALAIQSRQVA